jgi:hypothetical protein
MKNIFRRWFPKSSQATFFMRGGQTVAIGNVKSVSMTRELGTGQYSAYEIEWANPKVAPLMFTLSIPDIIAVIVE